MIIQYREVEWRVIEPSVFDSERLAERRKLLPTFGDGDPLRGVYNVRPALHATMLAPPRYRIFQFAAAVLDNRLRAHRADLTL